MAHCPLCELLKDPDKNPTFITEFDHSAAFLYYDQDAYLGRSMLILKEHHDHFHLAPVALQQAIVPEGIKLTTAILKAFGGFRANHMSLGNQVSHIHWHIIPRYPNDLNAGQAPLQSPNETRLSDARYQEIAAQIRAAL